MMKLTKVSNTVIHVEFDTQEQRNVLVKELSYKIPGAEHTAAFKSKKWGGMKCFITDRNNIKIGFAKHLFPKHSLVYDKTYADLGFEDIMLFNGNPNIERRQYQLDAINTIFRETIGIINCVMGSGKTLIAAGVCSYHLSSNTSNKVLFVVYDKNILKQSVKNFLSYGFNVTQFGDSIKDLSGDIVVATVQSLNRLKNPKEVLKHVTFTIMDEAHHSKAKSSRTIISKLSNCKYFIGLTATPHTKRTLDTAELTSVCGPIIFEYGFEDGIKDGRVAPVKAFFLDVKQNLEIKERVIGRKNYKYVWDTVIQDNPFRNNLIAEILNNCVSLLDTPNLVLVDRIEHGISLCAAMKSKPSLIATTMYGEDDISMRDLKKKQLMTDNINTLISTVVKEGIDFKISPVIAVNASGRKSFVSLIQFLGRITRPNEKFNTFRCYIDIINHEHSFVLNHSQERMITCKAFGINVHVVHSINELMIEIIKHYKECMATNVSDI